MFKVIEVKPLPSNRLWLRFDNGASGEVDLADIVGTGAFLRLKNAGAFEEVRIGPDGDVRWGDDLDLCSDALYLRLTGKRPEDIFPNLRGAEVRSNA